jgi:hypothetical protein
VWFIHYLLYAAAHLSVHDWLRLIGCGITVYYVYLITICPGE